MIDLDSFKLVNDLYGHDMGDKVLICFAGLIREAIAPEDLAGRMGGDEFIAFLHGVKDETTVAEMTRILNEELLRSAKEFMGEDMTIPLGASVGAVAVPEEGKVFADLYRMADKALYAVKQNGKHGYAFYRKASVATDNGISQAETLQGIQMILGERSLGKGAFTVDFEKLQMVYRVFLRLKNRYDLNLRMVQISLTKPGEQSKKVPEEIVDEFDELLVVSLRNSDVVTRMKDGTFLVLLTDIDNAQESEEPMKRVISRWQQTKNGGNYTVKYEVSRIGG